MTKKLAFILLVWFFLFPFRLFSQNREYQLSMSKDNISWMWYGNLNYSYRTGAKSRFFIQNNFTSNLFRQSARQNKWKDENTAKGQWEYQISPSLQAVTRIRSHVFSDENSFVNFSKYLLMQEVGYQPYKDVSIAPAIGWASEDIYSYRDQGWYTQLHVDVNNFDLQGYVNDTEARSEFFFFPGRRNQKHSYYMAFNKRFSDFASDSLRAGYEFIENFYHLAQSEMLENVEVNSRFLYNELHYKLFGAPILNVETRLQNRDVSQSNPGFLNRRQEFNLSNKVGLRYSGSKFQGGLSFLNSQVTTLASTRPELGKESRNDIDGLQAAFNLFLNWRMSDADDVRLSFSYTKYEYSSPDTTQRIDEDDLRFITDLQYRHRFSDYFMTRFKAHLYLYHQIYIHSGRSANNNWNRIYQLTPSFHFTLPGRLKHVNQLKILANYTVYDFEEILPRARSYVYRKLIYTDSLKLHLSQGLDLATVYQLEKEDNGTFFKSIFAQQISRELTSHFIDISLIYKRIDNLQITTGVNWYLRKEWSFVPEKNQIRDYYAFSPRLMVMYRLGRKLILYMSFAPKVYRDIHITRNYYGTGKVNLKYLF